LIVVVVSGTFDLTTSGGQAISMLAEMVTAKEDEDKVGGLVNDETSNRGLHPPEFEFRFGVAQYNEV
jgi:hypothetical protein